MVSRVCQAPLHFKMESAPVGESESNPIPSPEDLPVPSTNSESLRFEDGQCSRDCQDPQCLAGFTAVTVRGQESSLRRTRADPGTLGQ